MDYDYALLLLNQKVNLVATTEPKVGPVCLPPANDTNQYVNKTSTVTGWGATKIVSYMYLFACSSVATFCHLNILIYARMVPYRKY